LFYLKNSILNSHFIQFYFLAIAFLKDKAVIFNGYFTLFLQVFLKKKYQKPSFQTRKKRKSKSTVHNLKAQNTSYCIAKICRGILNTKQD
jgi:hypothetical protein